ncbi:hypothetical protein [Micromonospora sp. KC207]|uniref:hypothetical protein n=1 Tax=Micromonospora sp. KC207 TaxID=2530377 RepID=UPI0014049EC9|nr:hypothetical protein [Micromonospora sp. KC207]
MDAGGPVAVVTAPALAGLEPDVVQRPRRIQGDHRGLAHGRGQLVLSFNDDNLGDNGDNAAIVVRQWI